MTLLQLVQATLGELGLTAPTLVVGSADNQVLQVYRLANAMGSNVAREFPWQGLNKPYLFTTTATTLTGSTTINSTTITVSSTAGIDTTYQISGTGINQATFVSSVTDATHLVLTQPATSTNASVTFTLAKAKYSLPSDYDRPINNTHWDKTKHWLMLGPETAQQWEWLISGYISTGPRIRYRIFGSYFQIWPMMNANETLGFEYVSNAWASSSAGAAQSSFLADTDTCMFPDRLMVCGMKLKFFEAKGFETTALYRDYLMQLSLAKANDGQSPDVMMAPSVSEVLIGWNNIPDSGYGT